MSESPPLVKLRVFFGTIWFMVKAPPPRILQVSQWLLRSCQSYYYQLLRTALPEDVLAEVLVKVGLPGNLAAVADTVVAGRHNDRVD